MKKFLMGAAAAVALTAGSVGAHSADWFAVAANAHGYGEAWGEYEEDARALAVQDCEYKTGRSCYDQYTTSVPGTWKVVVVVRCPGGYSAAGGSKHNASNAQLAASQKLGYNRCRIIARYN